MSENVSTGYIPGMFPHEVGRLVCLTASQCRNVAEFIEFGLIDHIRNDPDLDNVRWIADMIEAWKALKAESGDEGGDVDG